MSIFVVYLKLKPFIVQWLTFHYGTPVRFPDQSAENACIRRFLTRQPTSMPAVCQPGEIAICIPDSKQKPVVTYNHLGSHARAAVADPPVMILDEATSSIDTRTELLVQKGMDNLMKGRTVFVIAHRLSTVQNSDVIMVLDHGRIIERGNHDELIAKKGTYYRLYTGAFELD